MKHPNGGQKKMDQKPQPKQQPHKPTPHKSQAPQVYKPQAPQVHSKPSQKTSYIGQPTIRIELSPVRVNGCSATEFLAWIRQQEGSM